MKKNELDIGAFFQNAIDELDRSFLHYRGTCESYILQRNAHLVTTPEECLIPAIEIQKILFAELAQEDVLPLAAMKIIPQAVALGNWRFTKSIYTFDHALYQELLRQPLKSIPGQLLRRLPEPCLFIRTPDNPLTGLGFFACFDAKDSGDLFLTLSFQTQPLSTVSLPLCDSTSKAVVKVILGKYGQKLNDATLNHFLAKLNGALQLLLYLCSENVVYDGDMPVTPQSIQEPSQVRYFRVGAPDPRENSRANRSVKFHLRRGHFHTYWVGSGDEKKPILKWLEDAFIHPERTKKQGQ